MANRVSPACTEHLQRHVPHRSSADSLPPGRKVVKHNTFAATLNLIVEVFYQQRPPNLESIELLRGQISLQRLLQPWSV